MKVYKNEFTKKILSGFTALMLMTTSYQVAHAITNTSNDMSTFKEKNTDIFKSKEITYEEFNHFYELVRSNISILEELNIYNSDIDFNKYGAYHPNYDIGLKVLIYFANYDYIVNTQLEDKLRDEKIVDTYTDTNCFGLDLDLNAAESILTDFLIYNYKNFNNIKYDDDEFIISREFSTDNLTALLNPSLLLINESDKKFVDLQFQTLLELIQCCSNNDKENIEKCLLQYSNIQKNYPNITIGAKWLNNLTNNAMCIKIIETYLIQICDKNLIEQLFCNISFSNLYFNDGVVEDEPEEYSVTGLDFSSISNQHLKLLLEYDRNLHSQVYCDKNTELLENMEIELGKNFSKNNVK